MDGKEHFRNICRLRGLDCDHYFKIGMQQSENNAGYVYQCPHTSRKPTQLYAVNYLQELDVYIAWSLREPKAETKDVFRVLKASLNALRAGALLPIKKPIEYSGWNEETVYAFLRCDLDMFLDMVERSL